MPRVYFSVHDGKSGLDAEGTDLPDHHAARIETIRLGDDRRGCLKLHESAIPLLTP